MTLTALRGRLYLFGGSGSSSKCFQDLQILDRKQMVCLELKYAAFLEMDRLPKAYSSFSSHTDMVGCDAG